MKRLSRTTFNLLHEAQSPKTRKVTTLLTFMKYPINNLHATKLSIARQNHRHPFVPINCCCLLHRYWRFLNPIPRLQKHAPLFCKSMRRHIRLPSCKPKGVARSDMMINGFFPFLA
ncbi:hypothetical protein E1A91_A07G114700v1 [Gossypium mustelinum]|uniref:Uncharacterized protein n=1 Tax=Gossypium mustelinum TaxID=34275 RepID=A0A5D2YJV1_GOSMU|nr:hypothetical protein E1A91_A07G114700v1 [Gossypium mustelinum]